MTLGRSKLPLHSLQCFVRFISLALAAVLQGFVEESLEVECLDQLQSVCCLICAHTCFRRHAMFRLSLLSHASSCRTELHHNVATGYCATQRITIRTAYVPSLEGTRCPQGWRPNPACWETVLVEPRKTCMELFGLNGANVLRGISC